MSLFTCFCSVLRRLLEDKPRLKESAQVCDSVLTYCRCRTKPVLNGLSFDLFRLINLLREAKKAEYLILCNFYFRRGGYGVVSEAESEMC